MKEIRFLTLANQEVVDAVHWYQERSVDLGRDFLNELDRVVRLVRRYPFVAAEIEPEIRRFLFTRFPYSLIYGIDDETIVVIAVAHHRREPLYWVHRA
ncbi:MAG TPA: type II toxin-antitoxin system RelE/ParE family toxin [Pyrinomonadaceae bacterium]|nr:type II toxin-antitoxin system RelE/ParE family toxin [Pyrinomonadaceae bacterium]